MENSEATSLLRKPFISHVFQEHDPLRPKLCKTIPREKYEETLEKRSPEERVLGNKSFYTPTRRLFQDLHSPEMT